MDAKTAHEAVERVLRCRGEERARMVVWALKAGATAQRLADAMGVTRQRVYQMRDQGQRLLAEGHTDSGGAA